ncbi:MAG TPA: NrfD/PsrC family molybdoenzyme membrane anchor subunit [Thermoanaerobaculia bacterium]
MPPKRPTAATEARLAEIRRDAEAGRLPVASAQAGYYGLPLQKSPVWTWEVPAYFFVGGAAGAVAVLGAMAQLAGADEKLVRDARRIAAIGSVLSAPLLISDLGRPERFLYMMRIFKPQSPMSVGAWTLAVFGATAGAAALGRNTATNIAAAGSAATGAVMATYTGVLLGATAIPFWAKHARLLPVHFGASALGSAVSLLELRGHRSTALSSLGLGAAVFESITTAALETSPEPADAPLHTTLARFAGALSGPVPLALRLLGGRSRRARQLAAVATLAGSLLTRFAWVQGGKQVARPSQNNQA